MTVGEFFTEVRRLLNDVDVPYRYTDGHLYRLLEVCINDLRRVRPDAFIGNINNLPIYPIDQTGTITAVADTTNIVVEPLFIRPMIHYVSGSAELIDEEFTADGRAAILLKSFADSVGSR